MPERTSIQRAEGAGIPFHADARAGAPVAKTFDCLLTQLRDRAEPKTAGVDAS